MIATGYFGIPGTSRTTRVHVVENGRPICGSHLGPGQKFQWCAGGAQLEYVECSRCKARLAKDGRPRIA